MKIRDGANYYNLSNHQLEGGRVKNLLSFSPVANSKAFSLNILPFSSHSLSWKCHSGGEVGQVPKKQTLRKKWGVPAVEGGAYEAFS